MARLFAINYEWRRYVMPACTIGHTCTTLLHILHIVMATGNNGGVGVIVDIVIICRYLFLCDICLSVGNPHPICIHHAQLTSLVFTVTFSVI